MLRVAGRESGQGPRKDGLEMKGQGQRKRELIQITRIVELISSKGGQSEQKQGTAGEVKT